MNKINMRTRILFTILPIAIIPIIIITFFSSITLFNKLEEQSNIFNSTVLKQVANNIDFIYSQYAMSFVDITYMDNFKKIIDHPQYTSQIEEIDFMQTLGESTGDPKGNTVTRATFSKFQGAFFIAELDKYSTKMGTNYLLYRLSLSNAEVNVDKLKNDKMFSEITKEKATLIFAKPEPGVLTGYDADKLQIFLFPYYREEDTELKKILFLVTDRNFIPDLYKDIDSLKYGTLYVLDRYDNVLSYNHPSDKDEYEYDKTKKKYIFSEGDVLYNKDERIGIKEYRLLNTDPTILNTPKVTEMRKQISNPDFNSDEMRIVRHNGINYLFCAKYAPASQVKLFYFHPLQQIYTPIYDIITWTIIIGFGIIFIIASCSFIFSKLLTKPIKDLSEVASKISGGNYKIRIKTKGFFGEFIDLANSFNNMVKTVNDYNEHLEELVKDRTEELNKKNNELKLAYDENKKELIMAQRIQNSLIPEIFPESDKLAFHGLYLPMETLGGDLYDVHKITDTKWGIVILDVCGHGVPAALITTMAKISFNANSKKYQHSNEIVHAVNNELCEAIQGSGDYFTAFYCIIDTKSHTLEYTNAAHNDLYILKQDSSLLTLSQTGPVVGVLKNIEYASVNVYFNKNERLVMYTDGVIEARNEKRELYDSERLKELIKQNKNADLLDFVRVIYEDIIKFKNNTPHDDDIAMLAVDMVV